MGSLRSAIEDSPDTFYERFVDHTFEAELLPVHFGSPVLEVLTPHGVLVAFDRGLPPGPNGLHRILLHGELEQVTYSEVQMGFEQQPQGRVLLKAMVVRGLGQGHFLVDLGFPVVVFGALEPGREANLLLKPPLMAFRSDTQK
jgi:hypothetical protein